MARSGARDEIAANAKAEYNQARSAFSAMRSDLRDTGRKAQHALASGIDAGRESMRQAMRRSSRAVENARREMSSRVRERPLVYTGGAIAVGVLLGMLLRGLRR
jgi:ElaB/YqjD/DUF883 family membrane-anchored ribosome-binding protein